MATILEKANQILDEKTNKIIPENIKSGVQIFDVTGTLDGGIDTSDATATADDIAFGKTAYINGEKIEGMLPECGQIGGSGSGNINIYADSVGIQEINSQRCIVNANSPIIAITSNDNLAEAIGLTPEKIAKNNTILGVTGTFEGGESNNNNAKIENYTGGKLCESIVGIELIDTNSVTNMAQMFYGFKSLVEIPLLDTSNVTDMSGMFDLCENLTAVPMLNTNNVTNMNAMFEYCENLTTVPQLNTSNVTNMYYMFYNCQNLTIVPQLNTSNVTNMESMFENCNSLSDESLNNILAMCANATAYISQGTNMTLRFIGLSSGKATKCTTLSNYQAFIDAGWTTGY